MENSGRERSERAMQRRGYIGKQFEFKPLHAINAAKLSRDD